MVNVLARVFRREVPRQDKLRTRGTWAHPVDKG